MTAQVCSWAAAEERPAYPPERPRPYHRRCSPHRRTWRPVFFVRVCLSFGVFDFMASSILSSVSFLLFWFLLFVCLCCRVQPLHAKFVQSFSRVCVEGRRKELGNRELGKEIVWFMTSNNEFPIRCQQKRKGNLQDRKEPKGRS